MNRNSIAVAFVVAILAGGGLFVSLGEDQSQSQALAVSPATYAGPGQYAGAIDGNVPTIASDNVRAYTMIVLPPNSASDPFCQQVVQAFGGNATIRGRSIVKLHNADSNFCYRWGRAFESATRGYPMVAVMHECGDTARCVDYVTLSAKSNLASEVNRITKAIVEVNINDPFCPKPAPAPAPGPNNQPTLPPLDDKPATPELASDDKAGLILVAVVAAIAGLVSYYKRD